jgi:hypothetical protein
MAMLHECDSRDSGVRWKDVKLNLELHESLLADERVLRRLLESRKKQSRTPLARNGARLR